ncbi:MAG: PEP-CTERM sorting domain-containing protein [Lacipirellulaceae bacterium]
MVNAADYTVWRDAVGSGAAVAVPEPQSTALVAVLAGAVRRRRRA